ncbi:YqeB [Fictibacillus macauensis ZFHKF-1]|uniref:YqeB n=2 Tax=Fictibacillus TaxID=1329200 RepID=I8UHT6_9BACL|nr:YqeB [Fictibacillus macauensis ZFHKF-1]
MTVHSKESTSVGYTPKERRFLYGLLSLTGLILGYFLPKLAAWALTLPWIPFSGPLRLITSFNHFWPNLAIAGGGLIAGILLAFYLIKEAGHLEVTDDHVSVTIDERSYAFPREDIGAVYFDQKKLVLLTITDVEVMKEHLDFSSKKIRDAFTTHSYPWYDRDPYFNEYKRWIPDSNDLPSSVNAIFKAREKALKNEDVTDSIELREELQKLGFNVREEKLRQYWRTITALEQRSHHKL